jgi:transposase
MHDNAPIHTHKVRDFLVEHGMDVIDWPPYSPDMNPIEYCWAWIKEWINNTYPELIYTTKKDNEASKFLEKAIFEAWEAMSTDYLETLIKSMSRRCEVVIAVEG